MKTRIFEVEEANRLLWGKFMVGIFDEEWGEVSEVDPGSPLLTRLGWVREHFLLVDLSVGHAAIFRRQGDVDHDVKDRGIYFCPMLKSFLCWFRREFNGANLEELPRTLVLPEFNGPVFRDGEHYEGVPHRCMVKEESDVAGS